MGKHFKYSSITVFISVFNLKGESAKMIAAKVTELRARIKWCALASAAGGALPVPGVSTVLDLSIITNEARLQREQLEIEAINSNIKRLGAEQGDVDKYIESIYEHLPDDAKKFAKSAMDNLSMAIVGRIAISEGSENVVKLIPIFGSIIGGTISASMCLYVLGEMLETHEKIALSALEVISKLETERNG